MYRLVVVYGLIYMRTYTHIDTQRDFFLPLLSCLIHKIKYSKLVANLILISVIVTCLKLGIGIQNFYGKDFFLCFMSEDIKVQDRVLSQITL